MMNLLYKNDMELVEELGRQDGSYFEVLEERLMDVRTLAERKGIISDVLVDINVCRTIEDLAELERKVYDFKEPTQVQLDLAEKLCNELGKPVPKVSLNHDKMWFSKLIEVGIEKSNMLPPTENQQNLLNNMYYCPDIPKFEGTTKGEASEYIKTNSSAYSRWSAFRASAATIKLLRETAKEAKESEEHCSYAYCHQFTEAEAQELIKILEEKRRNLQKQILSSAISWFDDDETGFRQDFIDADEEARKLAAKNGATVMGYSGVPSTFKGDLFEEVAYTPIYKTSK